LQNSYEVFKVYWYAYIHARFYVFNWIGFRLKDVDVGVRYPKDF